MQNHKNRKLNRLKEYDYSQEGLYFITICANNRECFFGDIRNSKMELSEIGEIAQACLEEIPSHFPNVILDEYNIMPNHIHSIVIIENPVGNNNNCSGNNCSKTVGNNNNYSKITGNKIVGNKNFCSLQEMPWQTKWARSLSSIVRGFKIGVTKLCRENNFGQFAWQKSYYDHIIRNENSLNKIREYIINNPSKWEFDRNNSENLLM
jgi:putative transposase